MLMPPGSAGKAPLVAKDANLKTTLIVRSEPYRRSLHFDQRRSRSRLPRTSCPGMVSEVDFVNTRRKTLNTRDVE